MPRLLGAFLLLLFLLGLTGWVAIRVLPELARTRWLPELGRRAGLHLSIDRMELDLLGLALGVEGLVVTDVTGQAAFSATALRVKLAPWPSWRNGWPALAVAVDSPVLRCTRTPGGNWSVAGWLIQGGSPAGPASLPLHMSHLRVRDGRIRVEAVAASGSPVTRDYAEIALDIEGRPGQPDAPAPVHLSARGQGGEGLDVRGRLGVAPLRVEGTADLEQIDLAFWAGLFRHDGGWRLARGRLTGRLGFGYPGSAPVHVDVWSDGLGFSDLALVDPGDGSHRLVLSRVALDHVRLASSAAVLEWAGASLGSGESPWGRLGALRMDRLTASLAEPAFTLEGLELERLETPVARVDRLRAGPIVLHGQSRTVSAERIQAGRVETPRGALAEPVLESLSLESGGSWRLALGRLAAASAGGPWGRMAEPRLEGVVLSPRESRFGLESASARDWHGPWGGLTAPVLGRAEYHWQTGVLAVAGLGAARVAMPRGRVAGITGARLEADLSRRTGTLAALAVDRLGILEEGGLDQGYVADLRLDGTARKFTAAHGRLEALRWGEARAGRLEWGGLTYMAETRQVEVKTAVLTDAVAGSPPAAGTESPARAGPDPSPAAEAPGAPDVSRYLPRQARLGSLGLEDARLAIGSRWLSVGKITTNRAELDVIRRKEGHLVVRGLSLPLAAGEDHPSGPAWKTEIGELGIGESSIHFFDETTEPNVRLRLEGLALRVVDVTDNPIEDTEFRLRGQIGSSSRIEAEGRLHLDPFRASFRFGLDKLRLRAIEPYFDSLGNIDLERGNLSLWGDVIVRRENGWRVDYAGGSELLDVEALDRVKRQPVLKWDMLKFDGLSVSNDPPRFVTRILTAEKPYARIELDERRRLNLVAALEPPSQAAIPPSLQALRVEETPRHRLPSAAIGLLRVRDGVVDFSDRSLKPGFTAEIRQFDGTISGLTSRVDAIANWVLKGRINGSSPVQVFGEVDPMDYLNHTDATLMFKGLNLASFSSYTGKFGGYRIEKGKLDMDLRYRLRNGRVDVDNRVVFDRLTLGKRVDDSGSWLVDLAIAILKGRDGRIDINLPVYGDLSNPQFSLWLLYRDVLTSLIAEFIYTPANLFELALEDGNVTYFSVDFAPGESALDKAATDRLERIAAAMASRLGATLDIQGSADPKRDRLALADKALQERLRRDRRTEMRAQRIRWPGPDLPELTDEDHARLFTVFYRQKYPDAPENRAMGLSLAPLAGAALESARRKTLEQWPIDETALRKLAQERAESLRGYLIEDAGVADRRIFLRDGKAGESQDGSIPSRLMLEGA